MKEIDADMITLVGTIASWVIIVSALLTTTNTLFDGLAAVWIGVFTLFATIAGFGWLGWFIRYKILIKFIK